jgi:hypothetical protein
MYVHAQYRNLCINQICPSQIVHTKFSAAGVKKLGEGPSNLTRLSQLCVVFVSRCIHFMAKKDERVMSRATVNELQQTTVRALDARTSPGIFGPWLHLYICIFPFSKMTTLGTIDFEIYVALVVKRLSSGNYGG